MAFNVLTVCTGNICRSPMAAGLLTHLLPPPLRPLVSVQSAGIFGLHGNRAAPFAVDAAAAYGADISDHRARLLTAPMVKAADLVLAMETVHLDRINDLLFFGCRYAWLMGSFDPRRSRPEIEDPYGLAPDAYNHCAAELVACIPGVVGHIRQKVLPKSA